MGHAFVHTVIDDYSRIAFTEVHDDETAITAASVLERAVTWFAQRGTVVEREWRDHVDLVDPEDTTSRRHDDEYHYLAVTTDRQQLSETLEMITTAFPEVFAD